MDSIEINGPSPSQHTKIVVELAIIDKQIHDTWGWRKVLIVIANSGITDRTVTHVLKSQT